MTGLIHYRDTDGINNVPVATATPLPVTLAGASSGSSVSTAEVQTSYTLLSNATATGASVPSIVGASYVWSISSTGWNGATATLQTLGPDGVTWQDVLAKTANYTGGVVIGNLATARVAITVAVPSAGVYSNLS